MSAKHYERAERAKRIVGQASYGTDEYWRKAAIVLSQFAGDMNSETRAKLQSLAQSGDEFTRNTAREALAGSRYVFSEEFDDDDQDDGDDED